MAMADGLKHGRPLETIAVVCDCECTRYLPCPVDDDSPCKKAYIVELKALKAIKDAKES